MLVLSRRLGEGLLIDGNTVVRILEVRGNRIRLGIEAPDNVTVVRKELSEKRANFPDSASVSGNQADAPRDPAETHAGDRDPAKTFPN